MFLIDRSKEKLEKEWSSLNETTTVVQTRHDLSNTDVNIFKDMGYQKYTRHEIFPRYQNDVMSSFWFFLFLVVIVSCIAYDYFEAESSPFDDFLPNKKTEEHLSVMENMQHNIKGKKRKWYHSTVTGPDSIVRKVGKWMIRGGSEWVIRGGREWMIRGGEWKCQTETIFCLRGLIIICKIRGVCSPTGTVPLLDPPIGGISYQCTLKF